MRFLPKRPWTRAHEKFAKAWGDLSAANPCLEMGSAKLERWIFVRWGKHRIRELTVAEARAGARQLNAWRGSLAGRRLRWRRYPRQERRNYRLRLLREHSPNDGDFKAFERWVNEQVARHFSPASARHTAGNTTYARGDEFENLISGTVLADLGRLSPTESRGQIQ